ncbi:MAG: hypothetical protein NUV77_18055 [Thermoguttaceae bacterium]|jgi:hypothetical protein|nr:hypothetical protein [Thermoguttaceae bacterium]
MKIPVLIEPISHERYRATASEPFVGSVEAETPDAALAKLKERIDERLAQGARIALIDLPSGTNPWLDMAGVFHDDPFFDDWQQAIADYRRGIDEDPNAP